VFLELSNEVRAERKDRWRFQISMKFEKIEVNAERFNNGSEASRDVMIGVRKCYSIYIYVRIVNVQSVERTH